MAKIVYYIKIAFLLILVHSSCINAQHFLDPSFDAYVEEAMQDWSIPGMALGIIKDNQVIVAKGYGVKRIGNADPIDEWTVFPLASVTKSFTATLFAMLVEKKKLDWDDPIVKHLPEFQLYDPYLTKEITIRDLLSHRAGFGRAENLWYLTSYNQQEILERLRYLKPKWSIRSRFSYSNISYSMLGLLIEAVTGKSWGDLIRERIFNALGMTSSIADMKKLPLLPDVATSHILREGRLETREWLNFENCAPAIAISSNAVDLLKWVSYHMQHDTGFLSEAHSPQTIINDPVMSKYYPESRFLTYGFGLFVHDYAGKRIVQHMSAMEGANALIAMIPEEKLGIVILINKDTWGTFPQNICYKLYDIFFHSMTHNWSEEFLLFYQKMVNDRKNGEIQRIESSVKGTTTSLPLYQYTGTYKDLLYGQVQVNMIDDTLSLSSATFNGKLEHCYLDTFRLISNQLSIENFFVTFSINAQGDVTEMQVETPEGVNFIRSTGQLHEETFDLTCCY